MIPLSRTVVGNNLDTSSLPVVSRTEVRDYYIRVLVPPILFVPNVIGETSEPKNYCFLNRPLLKLSTQRALKIPSLKTCILLVKTLQVPKQASVHHS